MAAVSRLSPKRFVRLREKSESSALDVQRIVETIQSRPFAMTAQSVRAAAETAIGEAATGTALVRKLDAMREDIKRLNEGSARHGDRCAYRPWARPPMCKKAPKQVAAAARGAVRRRRRSANGDPAAGAVARSGTACSPDAGRFDGQLRAGIGRGLRGRADRRHGRRTLRDDSTTFECRGRDHGSRGADQPRRADAGSRHAANLRSAVADRAERRARAAKRRAGDCTGAGTDAHRR